MRAAREGPGAGWAEREKSTCKSRARKAGHARVAGCFSAACGLRKGQAAGPEHQLGRLEEESSTLLPRRICRHHLPRSTIRAAGVARRLEDRDDPLTRCRRHVEAIQGRVQDVRFLVGE